MGLDKKPTPPPKRVKEDEGGEESLSSRKDAPEMETERTGDNAAARSEGGSRQPQDTDTHGREEETAADEDKVRDGTMSETPEHAQEIYTAVQKFEVT